MYNISNHSIVFFFFSSRRRHTRCGRDWSSDVCSSDLLGTYLSGRHVMSAASDWSRFPLGTRFRIATTNEEYMIDDYGMALVGTDTIDLYKSSRLDMRHWGVRYVDIDILQWGSEERSLKVLAPRCKNHCVRQMVSALEKKRGKTVAQQTTHLRSL